MAPTPRPSFGIMTAPQQVAYDDVLRVWREADAIPEIDHAWLFDHLMPIGGDPTGRSSKAGRCSRPGRPDAAAGPGTARTSNRFRPPAMLAKIAATVDVVSGGRLQFGIGAGSRPAPARPWREYPAYGLPFHDFADAVAALAEACTVIRRLWTEDEPFDFDGVHVQLPERTAIPSPPGRPPVVIGGRTARTLRVVAEHADVWNMPGGDIDDACRRSALLDACAPRSAATPPRSPARSTCRSPTSGPRRRVTAVGAPPSRPDSATSSSACRRPTPTASRAGSPMRCSRRDRPSAARRPHGPTAARPGSAG